MTLGKDSGEKSKEGSRKESEYRRQETEIRKEVLLKGRKKEEVKCKEEAK